MRAAGSTDEASGLDEARRRRRWWLLGVVACTVGAVVLARQLLAYERIVDLEVYRMGGQALLDGRPLYDVRFPTDGLPFTYPPFAALAFVPFALLPVAPGVVIWALLSMAALARICMLLVRATPSLVPRSWPTGQAVLALFVVAMFLEPVLSTVAYGQINLVLVWLVLEDLLRVRPSRHGGVMVGLATALKLTPAVFVIYLWSIGRRADAGRATLVAAVTVAVGFAVQPGQASRYWTGVAYDTSRIGRLGSVRNQSLTGTVERWWGLGDHRIVTGALAVTAVVATILLGRRLFERGEPLLAVCAVATGGLLASPVSWTHHWLWLFVIAVAVTPFAKLVQEPAHSAGFCTNFARGVLVGVILVAAQSIFGENASLVWRVSDPDDTARGLRGLEQLWGSGYVLVGLAFLGFAAVVGLAGASPGSAAAVSGGAARSARRTRR